VPKLNSNNEDDHRKAPTGYRPPVTYHPLLVWYD
jgi:hypothetical protein